MIVGSDMINATSLLISRSCILAAICALDFNAVTLAVSEYSRVFKIVYFQSKLLQKIRKQKLNIILLASADLNERIFSAVLRSSDKKFMIFMLFFLIIRILMF